MKEQEFKYSLSPMVWTQKPPKREFGKITDSITQATSTIQEFVTNVSPPFSRCWSGGLFEGTICNVNWQEQSIIGLDFDSGMHSVEDVFKIFLEYNIIPNLYYKTFSNTEQHPRFRVVIFLDKPITDKKSFKLILDTLNQLLDIDKKCKDLSRRFLGGGDSAIIKNDTPISLEKLLDVIEKINLKHYIKENSCSFSSNFSEELLSYYSTSDFISFNSTFNVGETRIDWDGDLRNIQILKEFLSGTWLFHDQLFGLATNLKYISGGLKKMKETMINYNKLGFTQYSKDNFYILEYVRKMNYFPMSVKKFSKYEQDSKIDNLISLFREKNKIRVIEQRQMIELEDAENQLQERFNEVIENGTSNTVFIFRLPTAIGKTTLLTNVERTIIALPTNDLKNEVKSRMNVPSVITPDPVDFMDPALNTLIERYYTVGLANLAMGVIKDVAEGRTGSSFEDMQEAGQYIYQLSQANDIDKSVLTTHKRILNADSPIHDTIIFDEDPLNSLVEIRELKLQDLSGLYFQYQPLKEVLDYFKTLAKGIYETPRFNIDIDDFIDSCNSFAGIETNVFEFFKSRYFIYEVDRNGTHRINYVVKKEFPSDMKIIIMSATVSPEIYRKLYPDVEFEVFDISNVQQSGQIIQYTENSYSRLSLKNKGKSLSDELEEDNVITFKGYKHLFKNPVNDIHFGNCSGYDTLNGQNLAVVGTPHGSIVQYYLIGKLMNIKFEMTESPMNNNIVQYNGFEFTFYCFNDLDLRLIQFYIIESDLIQAVGRARTLRKDCIVEVYSNFPLPITTEFKNKNQLN